MNFDLDRSKMNASQEARDEEEEDMPVISVPDTPTNTRNTERSYQNQLPVYLILARLLFERIVCYSIAANLAVSLGAGSPVKWSEGNSILAEFIFTGK